MIKNVLLSVLAVWMLSGCSFFCLLCDGTDKKATKGLSPDIPVCDGPWYNDPLKTDRELLGISISDRTLIKKIIDMNKDATEEAIKLCSEKCTFLVGPQKVVLSSCCPYKDELISNKCKSIWDSDVLVQKKIEESYTAFCDNTNKRLRSECQKNQPNEESCLKTAEKNIAECKEKKCFDKFSEDWTKKAVSDFRLYMPICDSFVSDFVKIEQISSDSRKEGRIFVIINKEP
jgi:hypothetical protein